MTIKLTPSEEKHYLKNSELLLEVLDCKAKQKISNKLAAMLLILTRRYATKPNFSGYTYINDMCSEALTDLCKNALKFNPEKSSNPFAFYTQCIHNSFLGYLNTEKKHRKIRDALLIDIGENPSFNFQEEYNRSLSDSSSDTRDEMRELSSDIEEAKIRRAAEIIAEEEEKAQAKIEAESLEQKLINFEDDPKQN